MSAVFQRAGHPFVKGFCPPGSALALQRNGISIPAQFDDRSTWSDGSLKNAVIHFSDTALAAGASNSYTFAVLASTSFANTGSVTLAQLSTVHAPKVVLTNLAETEGQILSVSAAFYTAIATGDTVVLSTTGTLPNGLYQSSCIVVKGTTTNTVLLKQYANDQNPITLANDGVGTQTMTCAAKSVASAFQRLFTQVGSGTFTADFNTHAAISTRVEKVHSGAVCDGWTAWGMFKDQTGGVEDPHLKVNWHSDAWKNTDGSLYALECGPVLAQDWYSIANKKLRRYTATFYDGATVVCTFSNVEHPYGSQWLMCQNASDNQRGRRFWLGGACPMMTYKPDLHYWSSTGILSPFDPAQTYNAYPTTQNLVYVPCGTADQRGDIDGTGGYDGRGVMPGAIVTGFMRQTAADYAVSRINGLAGLGVPYHFRSNRTRTRPGDSAADIANTPISMIQQVYDTNGTVIAGAAPAYDFTAAGMPAPVHAYTDGRSDPSFRDSYVYPAGGSGAWTPGQDNSHSVNFSFGSYLLEGERYHLEALLDHMMQQIHGGISNQFSARPTLQYACGAYGSESSAGINGAPNNTYDAVANIMGQDRSAGWVLAIQGSAAGIIPDAHVAASAIKRQAKQTTKYMADLMAYLPADAISAGTHPIQDTAACVSSPWQCAFSPIGGYHHFAMTEDVAAKNWAQQLATMTATMTIDGPYLVGAYRGVCNPKAAAYGPANRYTAHWRSLEVQFVGTVGSAVLQFNTNLAYDNTGVLNLIANGDQMWINAHGQLSAPITLDTNFPDGTPYYVIGLNKGAGTLGLSATAGGAPIALGSQTAISVSAACAAINRDTVAQGSTGVWDPNGYAQIHMAALTEAYRYGHPLVPLTLLNKLRTFAAAAAAYSPPFTYAVPA